MSSPVRRSRRRAGWTVFVLTAAAAVVGVGATAAHADEKVITVIFMDPGDMSQVESDMAAHCLDHGFSAHETLKGVWYKTPSYDMDTRELSTTPTYHVTARCYDPPTTRPCGAPSTPGTVADPYCRVQ